MKVRRRHSAWPDGPFGMGVYDYVAVDIFGRSPSHSCREGKEATPMLCLTRRHGETIRIGADVTVTIVNIKDDTIRIGINAPKDVAIHRKEIFNRIHEENSPVGEDVKSS